MALLEFYPLASESGESQPIPFEIARPGKAYELSAGQLYSALLTPGDLVAVYCTESIYIIFTDGPSPNVDLFGVAGGIVLPAYSYTNLQTPGANVVFKSLTAASHGEAAKVYINTMVTWQTLTKQQLFEGA